LIYFFNVCDTANYRNSEPQKLSAPSFGKRTSIAIKSLSTFGFCFGKYLYIRTEPSITEFSSSEEEVEQKAFKLVLF